MGFTKNQYKGELAKKGAWIVFRFKLGAGGALHKEEGGVFEVGVDTPMHTMS